MDKKWRKSIFQLLPLDGRYFLNVALNRCLAVSIEEKLVVLNLMNRLTAKSETLVILLIYLKFTKKKKWTRVMLNNDKKENCKNFRPLSFHKLCVHMHVNAEEEIWKKPMALEYLSHDLY